MEVSLAQLSPAQLRKLHTGHPVRAKLGHHHRVMVSHEHAKKLMSAHKKGASATIGGRLLTNLKGDVSTVAQAGTDYAVGKIAQRTPSGSGVHRRHHRRMHEMHEHRRHEMHEHGEGLMHHMSGDAHMMANKELHSVGGKVNRLNKFNRWFKSIGQKTKTLNHNLKPIKQAATARAADYITMYNNPQAQAQALLDTTQSEASQFRHLAGRRHKSAAPSYASYAPPSYASYVPAPTQYSVPPTEPYPIDVNGDGQPEGYFYPNEKQYFGGKVKKHRMHHMPSGSGTYGDNGRQLAHGSGKKRAPSAWVQHVKAYAHHHGIKYGDALKQARASYKSGGALYPAGYDPNQY
jgi:hypothetical protein